MLSLNRKTDMVKNGLHNLINYPHTGPFGHSEPIGWRLVETDTTEPHYEKEPKGR